MSCKSGRPQRLIARVLTSKAREHPEAVISLVPSSSRIEDGFREVTCKEFAGSAAYIAKWLTTHFSLTDAGYGETIAYIGTSDIRYSLMFFAVLLLHRKLFLPSPRNPKKTNLALLTEAGCTKVVHSEEVTELIQTYQADVPELELQCLPCLADLLSSSAEEYVYDRSFEDAYKEPVLILHSSGSTGRPKAVSIVHGAFSVYDPVNNFPSPPGRKNFDLAQLDFPEIEGRTRVFESFPPFHIFGFVMKVVVPMFTKTAPIYGPAGRPPSLSVTKYVLENVDGIKAIVMPPSIWEELSSDPKALPSLNKLEFISFAGGPLAAATGNRITKHTAIAQFYGSTEMGQIHQIFPAREDWAYFELNPAADQEMQMIDKEQGTFELVLPIKASLEGVSSLNYNFPKLKEWRTKDLFVQHPTKPNLWKFYGRVDDILVLSSGEKLFPVQFEQKMMDVSGVSGAILVGNGRPRTGLLVEVASNANIDSVRKDVEKQLKAANSLIPEFGRISMLRVLFSIEGKRMIRSPKGTVIRRQTEDSFSSEIEELLKGEAVPVSFVLKPTVFDKETIVSMLKSIVYDLVEGNRPNLTDNLYASGMDSVKSVDLLQQLRSILTNYNSLLNLSWLSVEIIYNHPTIEELAEVVLAFLNTGATPTRQNSAHLIQSTIDRYVEALPKKSSAKSNTSETCDGFQVVLTGSTGFVGSHLLERLIETPNIRRIICLDRKANASTKLLDSASNVEQKVAFLKVDYATSDLGLEKSSLEDLLHNMDLLVHVAWSVDFNSPLQEFGPSFDGLINLIDICNRSRKPSKFHFISSITSAGIWTAENRIESAVSEALISDISTPPPWGYAQSKFVAEHILGAAVARTGLDVTITRLGYICSSADERQITSSSMDVTLAMIKTCQTLKLVPSDYLEVNWVSITDAASIVADLIGHDLEGTSGSSVVYNLVNPNPLAWSDAASVFMTFSKTSKSVAMKDWLAEISHVQNCYSIDELPVLRLWQAFDQVANRVSERKIVTSRLLAASPVARRLESISKETLGLWLESM